MFSVVIFISYLWSWWPWWSLWPHFANFALFKLYKETKKWVQIKNMITYRVFGNTAWARDGVHARHRFTSQQKEAWCWVRTMCLLSFIYKSYKRKAHVQTRSQTHRPPNGSTLAEITIVLQARCVDTHAHTDVPMVLASLLAQWNPATRQRPERRGHKWVELIQLEVKDVHNINSLCGSCNTPLLGLDILFPSRQTKHIFHETGTLSCIISPNKIKLLQPSAVFESILHQSQTRLQNGKSKVATPAKNVLVRPTLSPW